MVLFRRCRKGAAQLEQHGVEVDRSLTSPNSSRRERGLSERNYWIFCEIYERSRCERQACHASTTRARGI